MGGDRDWAFEKGWTLDMSLWREKGGDWAPVVLFRMVAGEDHRMHGRGEVVVEVILKEGKVIIVDHQCSDIFFARDCRD